MTHGMLVFVDSTDRVFNPSGEVPVKKFITVWHWSVYVTSPSFRSIYVIIIVTLSVLLYCCIFCYY